MANERKKLGQSFSKSTFKCGSNLKLVSLIFSCLRRVLRMRTHADILETSTRKEEKKNSRTKMNKNANN